MSLTNNFLALVGALAAMTAPEAEFPSTALLSIGFVEVRLNDLRDTETYAKRRAQPHGYLKISADLNGDGSLDEVRVLQNVEGDVAYVAAAIMTPVKLDTYILKSVPLSEVPYLAIDVAEAGAGLSKEAKGAGVAIFDLRTGSGEATFFDGNEFVLTSSITRQIPPS